MSTSSASSSIKGFPIDTGSHVPAAAGPSVGSPRRASTRMESWNSGTHDDWAGPPTANSDRLKRRRRSKATHEGSKSPSTFLAFFWDKDKDKTQPQRTVASAQVQPIFSDDIKGRLDSEGSKSQGPDRRGSMKPSHASEKCVQSMPAAYDVSPSAPRSIVSLSDRRNVMTARSVSSASSLASSSYQMSPQSSAGTSSSQCMSSIHSLNVDFNATSSFRANSVRSNSASAESHNDHRLSIVNSSQTKTGDSSRSSGSHSRTKGPNAGQIKKKSPGAAASTAIMDPSTKAMLSADQAFAAMFPYDESRTLRRQRQKADSISVAAEKLERGWNHAPRPHSSSFGVPDATGHQDYLTRIISPKTTVVPDAKAAQLKASTLRRPKTEDGSGGEGTRKQRGGFGTRFSAWLDKI
ncbi:unnamed protein product [Tilletia controversa]|uniref:Uncharacterized protein n=1 Tax=Tilletia controversa TaxID=13291 RepID=A0A8X7SSY3_9BASI|nr:hypothetical protein CF328_g8170 [Tilletia controversa]KAE8238400.1 hypothetical protein A4X06_0g8785 [Tilletia controversa]CAD6918431.1 unnamed protein product [Tilletia controversa]CAD6927693.1 unnamed protein product [Tilletia controversa]CAD6980738.1 unnamed protein product [Tilletia controversa]